MHAGVSLARTRQCQRGGETAASIALVALVSLRAEAWQRAGSAAARRVMSASIPTPRGQERTRAVP